MYALAALLRCLRASGFATMKIGEKAILKCRADYAYGDSPPVR